MSLDGGDCLATLPGSPTSPQSSTVIFLGSAQVQRWAVGRSAPLFTSHPPLCPTVSLSPTAGGRKKMGECQLLSTMVRLLQM